jgi:hypothetical protein
LTRVAGAAAAVPEDAWHEIVAMRFDASASQRFWSARGLVMPLGGGGRDLQIRAAGQLDRESINLVFLIQTLSNVNACDQRFQT